MSEHVAPVRHEVVVPVPPETAFDLYVKRPGRRHPADGRSGDPLSIVYEPFVGGRWYEVDHEGREYDWGRIAVWDPPRRLTLAWMVGANSGSWAYDPDPAHASRADITFEPVADGTRVRVEHTGFEKHGRAADRIRRGVDGGWAEDLTDLRRAADAVAPATRVRQVQVNLFCRDVERCVQLFTALGLPRVFTFPPEGPVQHTEVEAAGTRIGFTAADVANELAELGVSPGGARSAEVVLWTDDVDALHRSALDAGANALTDPADSPDGRLRTAWFLDPEGHQIKLVQHRRDDPMFENGFVNVYTDDMERCLPFYRDVLGFVETFRTPSESPDHVELTLNGFALALSTSAAAKTHQGIDAAPGAAAMCLTLWTTRLETAYTRLLEAGAAVVNAPHDAGNGNRNALVRDPDGNLIEIVTKETAPAT